MQDFNYLEVAQFIAQAGVNTMPESEKFSVMLNGKRSVLINHKNAPKSSHVLLYIGGVDSMSQSSFGVVTTQFGMRPLTVYNLCEGLKWLAAGGHRGPVKVMPPSQEASKVFVTKHF